MMNLAPIFSSQNYFRWKYLEVFSFAVSLSIYIWVRLKKVFCSSRSCQRISYNSNRPMKECDSDWGDQLTRALKKLIQIIWLWIRLWKIWKIFVYFKCKLHNEGLAPQFFCFLSFFRIAPKLFTWRVSSLWDQPFSFFCH